MAVKLIVVSDLHFGEPHGMFTDRDDTGRLVGNAVMDGVADTIAAVAATSPTPPVVVFNGDVLELAMAPTHVALDVFDQFVKRLFPSTGDARVAPRLVLLPGNHDHDLWRMSRDEIGARRVEHAPPDAPVPPVPPLTPIFGPLDPSVDGDRGSDQTTRSALLTRVLRHRNPMHPELQVVIASPSAATRVGDRVLALHHGHFTEKMYVAMSRLAHAVFDTPIDELGPGDLERDNGPWIDFVWSSLGREGAVGASIRRGYDLLNTDEGRALLASRLAVAAEGHGKPWLVQRLRRAVAGVFALRVLDGVKADELRAGSPDAPEAATGVLAYIDGPLSRNLADGLAEQGLDLPDDLTFLYGHTHKPFASRVTTNGYAGTVRVYNSGGWVVDGPAARPGTGGAMLVVDDTLDVALVHLYDQAEDPGAITGVVDHADGPDAPSELAAALRLAIAGDPVPWNSLGGAARATVQRRRDEHRRALQDELAGIGATTAPGVSASQVQRLRRRLQRVEHREERRMHPHEARAWLARGTHGARTFFGRRSHGEHT